LLVAASAMSPAPGASGRPEASRPGTSGGTGVPGGGVPGTAVPGAGGGIDPAGRSPRRAGLTAVGGNWLPPDINAVFASGVTPGGGVSSASGGENTVSGSATDRSSSSPTPFVSVPAHGVGSAPPGNPGV
jgi:hypothetical protein